MQNLCSKCYRDLQLKEQQSSFAKMVLNQSLAPSSSTTLQSSLPSSEPVAAVVSSSPGAVDPPHKASEEEVQSQPQAQAKANRCMTCRLRVSLTGFKCRCGLTLCGSHRYPKNHGCEFNFKGMGREQIPKANPVIKAKKIEQI